MALPILDTATYELTLPSSDVQIKYRPFLVKEEKILLLAMESENTAEVTKALKEIVHTCTFGSINVEALPTFDLEYIFLKLRANSVSYIAKFTLTKKETVVKRGKNVAHLDGKIIADSGRVIASATGTWAIWDHKPASMS